MSSRHNSVTAQPRKSPQSGGEAWWWQPFAELFRFAWESNPELLIVALAVTLLATIIGAAVLFSLWHRRSVGGSLGFVLPVICRYQDFLKARSAEASVIRRQVERTGSRRKGSTRTGFAKRRKRKRRN